MKTILAALAFAPIAAALSPPAAARVLRMNTPAPSLTAARVKAILPPAQQRAWLTYLDRSARQRQADRASLVAELKPGQTPPPALPPTAR